jgi:hypothetical protein
LQLSEDFTRWRDDPVTKLVFKALHNASEAQKAAWDELSWGGGAVRGDDLERNLLALTTRADAYRSLEELSVGQLTQWLGIEDAE